MLALSIRQPNAELILRGVKTIEYRSRPTRKIGQRFAIYASKTWAGVEVSGQEAEIRGQRVEISGQRSEGRSPTAGALADLRPLAAGEFPLTPSELPTGVLVGSAIIRDCIYRDGWWHWHLTGVRRYKRPRRLKAGARPQPVWFRAA